MRPLTVFHPAPLSLQVIKMAEVFEGSLVRAVRRLEELLRQVRAAAAGVGGACVHA